MFYISGFILILFTESYLIYSHEFCGDKKYRNIGVGLFIKRYLYWMKQDRDMMKIDNFINNYTFVFL